MEVSSHHILPLEVFKLLDTATQVVGEPAILSSISSSSLSSSSLSSSLSSPGAGAGQLALLQQRGEQVLLLVGSVRVA